MSDKTRYRLQKFFKLFLFKYSNTPLKEKRLPSSFFCFFDVSLLTFLILLIA